MRNHQDVGPFWQKRANEEGVFGTVQYHLSLPIIPSHKLWAQVHIERKTDESAWKLYLHEAGDVEGTYKPSIVGITGPGEARAAWRLMVIEYWRAQCGIEFPKCRSKGHSIKAQGLWTGALEDETQIEYSLNTWTAWYYKLCYHCWQTRTNLLGQTDPDLVPDDPKSSPWKGKITVNPGSLTSNTNIIATSDAQIRQYYRDRNNQWGH